MDDEKKQNQNIKEPEKKYGLNYDSVYTDSEIAKKIEERKALQREKTKKNKRNRLIILGAILLFFGLFIFSFTSFFHIDSIEVRGNSYFNSNEIINMGHAELGENLIYQPHKSRIVNYLEENPYIKNAKVSRKLPSTLVITVEERKQIGGIKYDDDFLIIDTEGILLRKTRTIPKVTIIEGIVVNKIEIGEKIGIKNEELFEQAMDILNKIKEKDLYFVRLDMSKMYIKAYVYENLICKGTYAQIIDGIEKDRLHKILDELFDEGISRGTITFSGEGYASFVPTI